MLLLPVTALFYVLAGVRRWLYQRGVLKSTSFNAPVIVVGNISVGGTGKTPVVRALVSRLQEQHFKPGIVSRGYGATDATKPMLVNANMSATECGDEPLMLHKQTEVPVCVCANRSLAVQTLLAETDCDVVVSDDGMQHYAMSRDAEIAVVDGTRLFGNGWLLPSGPLREPIRRLNKVDLVAVQTSQALPDDRQSGSVEVAAQVTDSLAKVEQALHSQSTATESTPTIGGFYLKPGQLRNLQSGDTLPLSELKGRSIKALAGIGNPTRFYQSLRDAGATVSEQTFPDHHAYIVDDVRRLAGQFTVVTSKDAVKLSTLDVDKSLMYELLVATELDVQLSLAIDKLIERLQT